MRIAIVNDLKLAVEVLRQSVLRIPGTEVAWIAEDGRQAIERCAQDRPDVVLMDMQMPEMSGLEATMQIRREEANSGRRVPIVALTANTTPEDRQSCLHAGMDEVLPKPVSIPRLRAMLAKLDPTAQNPLSGPPKAQGEP